MTVTVTERPTTSLALVAATVARTPEAVAARHDGDELTYAELDRAASRVAARLVEHGVGPEVVVAVATRRDLTMAVALLAVAKSGGACLPLDPTHPLPRLRQVTDDARTHLVLTTREVAKAHRLGELDLPLQEIGADDLAPSPSDEVQELPYPAADALQYVIFTSGSTGRPKGIAMPHGPLAALIEWSCRRYQPRAQVLQYYGVTADVGYYELFWGWASGATVVIAGDEDRYDVARIAALVHQNSITRIVLPVSALHRLAEYAEVHPHLLTTLREVITTGERQVVTDPVRRMFARLNGAILDNHYGSTEVNVVTCPRLRTDPMTWPDYPDIGRPVGAARMYVLDEFLRPSPVGVVGDLYVSGIPLSRGYVGRPGTTAQAFVPDPYADEPDTRMYRMGDRARWRLDGRLECLGRNDDQLKIGGYRIEPGEIQSVLLRHPAVTDALVVDATNSVGEQLLVAYVVMTHPAPDTDELRQHTGELLPNFMVPDVVIALESLPLSANGKIDRHRLPEAKAVTRRTPPASALEQAIADIWVALLDLPDDDPLPVAREDNFFALGGHSLLVTQLAYRLRHELDIELPLRTIFNSPTISGLADGFGGAVVAAGHRLRDVVRADPVPLAPAQRGLWFVAEIGKDNGAYNNALVMRRRGTFDANRYAAAFDRVMARHGSLRTHFPVRDGIPVQEVLAPHHVPLTTVDLSAVPADRREEIVHELLAATQHRPFAMSGGPLLRQLVVTRTPGDHMIVVVVHHIVADGRSLELLWVDLERHYADPQRVYLPDPVQYAEYATWQHELSESGGLEGQLAYWKRALRGAPPVTELGGRPDPATRSASDGLGHYLRFTVDARTTARLVDLAQEHRATMFMTMLTAYARTLEQHHRGLPDDLVVGVPADARSEPELRDMIGMFTNMLPVRVHLDGASAFGDLLDRVRDDCLEAIEHQTAPFEQIVEAVRPPREIDRNPLFQVMFQLQHQRRDIAGPDRVFELADAEPTVPKFELSLNITHTGEELDCALTASADVLGRDHLTAIAASFARVLALVTGCDAVSVPEAKTLPPVAGPSAGPQASPAPPVAEPPAAPAEPSLGAHS